MNRSKPQRERLRRRYRPTEVRLLFIGESPPASGRFFYQGDSGLYRAIRNVFHAAYPSIAGADFLPLFQASGCYLIDACLEPVDRLDRVSRRAACQAGERSLSRNIAKLQPRAIVTLLRSIQDNVERGQQMRRDGRVQSSSYPIREDGCGIRKYSRRTLCGYSKLTYPLCPDKRFRFSANAIPAATSTRTALPYKAPDQEPVVSNNSAANPPAMMEATPLALYIKP